MINWKNKEEVEKYYKEYRKRNKKKKNDYGKQWHFEKAFNGMREIILERDNWQCVECGMTQEQHIVIFGRNITTDHIDGNRNNNSEENLQTLCLRCHSSKDRRRGLSK